jgi:tripartite-type tricarboxylate transporter receptor subunit TctC
MSSAQYTHRDDKLMQHQGPCWVGTAGIGTGQHMGLELFAAATGIKLLHVPFRGDSGAVTALLEKTVDAIVAIGTAVLGRSNA